MAVVTATAPVVKATAPAASRVPPMAQYYEIPSVRVSAPASTATFKFITPLPPFVRVIAEIVTLTGGVLPGAGGEWTKPMLTLSSQIISTGTGDTIQAYLPNQRAPGDLLVFGLSWYGSLDINPAPAVSGWTLIGAGLSPPVDGLQRIGTAMYWKRHAAVESDPFPVSGLGAATLGSQAWIEAYRGGLTTGDPVLVTSNLAATMPDQTWITAYGEAPSYLPSLPVTEPNCLIVSVIGGIGNYFAGLGAGTRRTSAVDRDYDLAKFRYRQQYNGAGLTLNWHDGIKIVPGHTGEFGWTSGSSSFAGVVAAFRPGVIPPRPGHYYLAKKAPATHLAGPTIAEWISNWYAPDYGAAPNLFVWELSPLAAGSGALDTLFDSITNQYPPSDVLFSRWCTPPLAGQTLGGTLTLVAASAAAFLDSEVGTQSTSTRWRIHAYVSVGESLAVRTPVIDRWIGATDLPQEYSSGTLVPTSGPISLSAVTVQAGDRLVLEIGYHVISAPTPPIVRPPQYFDSDWMHVGLGTGTSARYYQGESYQIVPSTVPWVDAVAGTDQSFGGGASWLQFSQPLAELPKPLAPVNDHISRATVVTTLPFTFQGDTTQSTDPSRGVWFRYTPTVDEEILLHGFGGNYLSYVDVYEGDSPAALVLLSLYSTVNIGNAAWNEQWSGSWAFSCNLNWAKLHKLKAGKTYWLRCVQWGTWYNHAPSSGGEFHLFLTRYAPGPPQADDLYLPGGQLFSRWRNNQLIDITRSWDIGILLTGIALDYSHRPVYDDFTDNPGGPWAPYHTGERYYLAFHDSSFASCGDLADWEHQINTMEDCFYPGNIHNCSLAIDEAGLVLTGWFGHGYTRHGSDWRHGSGDPAKAWLHTVALRGGPTTQRNADEAPIRRADPAIHSDRPDWNGLLAESFPAPYDATGTNYIALADDQTTVFYTSSAFYIPVAGGSQRILRYDLATATPLPDFATLPAHGPCPGLRGLCCLPDGGLLVCNGTQVDRLSAAGALVQSYVPTAATYPTDRPMLVDVHLTTEETRFWVLDNGTHDLFLFALTGAQLSHLPTGLGTRALTQFAVYTPPDVAPPDEPECVSGDFPIDVVPPPTAPTRWRRVGRKE